LIFPFFLGDVLLEPTFYAIDIFWLIVSIVMFVYIYLNKDKEYASDFKEKYYESIPSEKYPEILGIMMVGDAKENFFVASIFELIRKNAIKIAITSDKKDYILVNNTQNSGPLTKGEYYIIKWLFHYLGNDYQVLLSIIKKQARKNSGFFSYCFHEWANIVEVDAAQQNIFESKGSLFNDALVYFIISYVLCAYNAIFINNYLLAILIGALSTVFIIYTNSFKKRTKEANTDYVKWRAFINYVKKPDNNLHELDANTLSKLAVCLKVLKMEKYFAQIYSKSRTHSGNQLLVGIDKGVINDLDRAISKGIKYSEIATNILFSKNRGNIQEYRRVYNQDFEYIYKEKE
jgi:hypothetical protein